jgi:hypothetical protein
VNVPVLDLLVVGTFRLQLPPPLSMRIASLDREGRYPVLLKAA